MYFEKWLNINESSYKDLYNSTVSAFPKTKKRQHAIDPINIKEVKITPYIGFRTLFMKAHAFNEENGKEYNPMILFKKVKYHPFKKNENWISINQDGKNYIFEKIDEENEVHVRCNCKDFFWRFNYYDYLDDSLYSKVRKKYESKNEYSPANPMEMPGMCKHLIKFFKILNQADIMEH